MLELVLTDSALWKDLVEDQESVEKITQGLGIAHDDSYGWHLLNMVRQFRKADLDASVLGRIRALTASELRHVREIYLHRARARMLAEEPD